MEANRSTGEILVYFKAYRKFIMLQLEFLEDLKLG
jgi:hypothetical protein